MDFIKIKIPFNSVVGDSIIDNLIWVGIKGGAIVEGTLNGVTTISNIGNSSMTYERFNYDAIAYVVSLGGNVYNYQSYIAITLSDIVPSGIRDSVKINELEEEVAITWQEWISDNQPPITINNKTYISGYSHYSGFNSSEKPDKHLDGEEITLLRTLGYEVLNKEEFKIIQTE